MKHSKHKFQGSIAYLFGYTMGTLNKEGMDIGSLGNDIVRVTNTDYSSTDEMVDDYTDILGKIMTAMLKHDKTGNS